MKKEIANETISLAEINQCLAEILRHPKGAVEIRLPPGEVYVNTFPGGRHVYINFIKPSEVPVGSVYRTWLVRFNGDKPAGVFYFRSRRGETGDETLPPDD